MLISLGQCYLEFTQFRTNCSFNYGCPIKELFAEPLKMAIELALTFAIAPKIFHRYVDDSHAWFESSNNATECF